MRLIISGEQPFQILGTSFGVSASESDYTILYSIDGQTYTTLKSVSAGENVNISGRAIGTFYKLSGNTSTVEVVYGKTCEEIAGVGSINGETGEISLKTINGNSIIGEGNIVIEGEVTKEAIADALGYTPANEEDIPENVSELNNDAGYVKTWIGTQAEYDALGDDVDDKTFYVIND